MGKELDLENYLTSASAFITHVRNYYVAGNERDLEKEKMLVQAWEKAEKRIMSLGYRPLGLNELACYPTANPYIENPNLPRLKRGERALSHAHIYQRFILGKINLQETYSPERKNSIFGPLGLPKTSRYAERIREYLRRATNKKLEALSQESEKAIQSSDEENRDGIHQGYLKKIKKEKSKMRQRHARLLKEHGYV